jgi:hypothetical protein
MYKEALSCRRWLCREQPSRWTRLRQVLLPGFALDLLAVGSQDVDLVDAA